MSALLNRRYVIYLLATLLTFITLYIPQLLQPQLAALYHRSPSQGGLFTTMSLIPLAIAPLFYGYILGNCHPVKLLKYSLLGLAVANAAFALVENFYFLLFIRFMIGCLIPIVISAIITLLLENNQQPQRTLSIYITFTIIGGFMGRFLSSFFDSYFNWQMLCWIIALSLLVCAWQLPHPTISQKSMYQRPQLSDFRSMLSQRTIISLLAIIFISFFCFVAVLNYLPFILNKAFPNHPSFITGIMYSGLLIGAVMSLLSTKIIGFLGIKRSFALANIAFLLALLLLLPDHLMLIFCVLFLLCAAFFLIHSVAIAQVDRHSQQPKPLTNAFYTSFYYCGGVLGSWLPGVVYQHYQKSVFISLLLFISFIATLIIYRLPKSIE